MKHKPFIEIIDFEKELKEYKLLCRRKSKKFTYYLDWKNYIIDNVVKQISNQFSQNHLAPILTKGKVLRYGYVRDEELSQNDNCVAFNFALNSYPELKTQYLAISEESKKLKIELQFKQDTAKAARRKELEKILKGIRTKLKTEAQMLTSKAQVVATSIKDVKKKSLNNW